MSFGSLLIDRMDVLRRVSDLITNGGFADGTGWVTGTGWTIGSGSASYAGASGVGTLTQTLTASVDTKYRLSMDVTVGGGTPTLGVSFGGKALDDATASGEYIAEVRADTTDGLVFTGDGVGANDISIDNVVLAEIDSGGQEVVTMQVHIADVPCRLDTKRSREFVDGQYTSISQPLIFTEERDILQDDILTIKTRGGEAITEFDLQIDGKPNEISGRTGFHHVEVACIEVTH